MGGCDPIRVAEPMTRNLTRLYMPNIGETFRAGAPAPAAGTYQCSEAGCTSSFVASLAGAPLPNCHHPSAGWRLTAMPGKTAPLGAPSTPTQAGSAPARARSPKKPPAAGGQVTPA